MADVKNVMSVDAGDIKNIMGVEAGDIKNVIGLEFSVAPTTFFGSRFVAMAGAYYPFSDGNGYIRKTIDYKAATSNGNTSDFGDLTDEVAYGAGVSNGTRCIQMAGEL